MPGIVGYNFYIDGVKANDTLVTDDTFTFTGLLSNSDYSITATAVDAAGNESPQSAAFPFSTQSVSNEDSPLSDADKAAVDAIVAESMASAEGGSPGYLIDLHGPRGYYTKAYGNTYGTNRPLTTDDHFRMGSNTKMFLALATLLQIEQGNLSLDDTLDQYVPGVPNGNIITIRTMFEMRAGLAEPLADLSMQIRFWLSPTGNVAEQTLIDLSKGASTHTPDTTFAYCNGDAILMGAVLEAVTGRNIRDILIDDVITPLGLVDTTWPLESTIPLPSAGNYAMSMSLVGCAGALNTNLADLTKFARELRDGTLLSRDLHLDWINPTKGGPTYTGYELGTLPQPPSTFGYGYFIFSYGHWVGHGGSITGAVSPFGADGSGGFNTACLANPDNGATIVVMENKQTATAQAFYYVANHIAAYLYPGSMDQRTFGGQTAFPVSASVSITGGTPVVTVDNPNKVITPTGAVLHVLGGTPGASPSLAQPAAASLAVTGGTPVVSVDEVTFTPFNEENVNRVDRPTPDGCTGCWVTLIGAGAGGSSGRRAAAGVTRSGGGGGGGGAKVNRFFVALASLGSTYSVTCGTAGSGGLAPTSGDGLSGTAGGASTFTSGSVSISAGGGSPGTPGDSSTSVNPGGAGGTASFSGVAGVSTSNGTAGGGGAVSAASAGDGVSNGASNSGAAGGGGASGLSTTNSLQVGQPGGAANGQTPGAGSTSLANGGSGSAAVAGIAGAGAGSGGSSGARSGGTAAGYGGGGGGGPGMVTASSANAGNGGPGYTLIEWVNE